MATETHGSTRKYTEDLVINTVFTAESHDFREKVRPGTGREAGLGHAGVRAMHGAIAERTQRNSLMKTINRSALFAALR